MAQGYGGGTAARGAGGEKPLEGTAPADLAAAQQDEPLSAEREEELLDEHRQRFALCLEAERENRTRNESWELFALGGKYQWGLQDPERTPSAENDLPDVSINLIPQFVHQVVNDQRQNRQGIKVRPEGGGAVKEAADVYAGIIRDIEHVSHAAWAYDWAVNQAVRGGWGYVWVSPVYVDDETNNQELRIEWVPSRFDVVWDKDSRLPWGSDAKYAYRTGWVAVSELEGLGGAYAEAAKDAGGSWAQAWGERATWERTQGKAREVRVCSAWWLEQRLVTVDGITRPAVRPRLMWCKLTARRVVEGPRELPGHRIPGVRVVGNLDVLREGLRLHGLPEVCGPAQELFNNTLNDTVIRLSLHPQASVMAAEGTMGDNGEHQGDWIAAASGEPHGVLTWKPTPLGENMVAPRPDIVPFPGVPAGHVTLLQSAEHWLRASAGMYEASMGQSSGQEQSGRALMMRRREGDAATFHFHDNMRYALHALGEILIELIPEYYDWQEAARILDPAGEERFVQLAPAGSLKDSEDKPVPMRAQGDEKDAAGRRKVLFDLSIGRYGIVIDTGPSHATQREEASEALGVLLPVLKEHALLGMDVFLRNLDISEADVLAERFRALAMQVYAFLPDLEQAGPDGPSDQQKVVRLSGQVQQLTQQLQVLMPELARLQAEVQDKQQDRALEVYKLQVKQQIDQLTSTQALISDIVEAQGQMDLERLRAAVKIGSERLRAVLQVVQGVQRTGAAVPAGLGGGSGGEGSVQGVGAQGGNMGGTMGMGGSMDGNQ